MLLSVSVAGGLEGQVGSPTNNPKDALRREHCEEVDSNSLWTTGNYGVQARLSTSVLGAC